MFVLTLLFMEYAVVKKKKKGRGPGCVVCTNFRRKTRGYNPPVRYHQFPDPVKNPERFSKWRLRVRKIRMYWDHPHCRGNSSTWALKNTLVCSEHFMSSDYEPPHFKNLRDTAVPVFSSNKMITPTKLRSTKTAKKTAYQVQVNGQSLFKFYSLKYYRTALQSNNPITLFYLTSIDRLQDKIIEIQ